MPVSTTTYLHNSQGRPSYTNNPAIAFNGPPSPDRKKSTKRENQFVFQKGSKLHAFARDKAPYPYSYDKEVLDWLAPITRIPPRTSR